MDNHQPAATQTKQWPILKLFITFGAGLVAAVPLFDIAGSGLEKLVGYGKIQSTVEMQAKLITDLQAEKKTLSDKADQLQTKTYELELKLSSSESNLANANQQLAQSRKVLDEYKVISAQLGQRIKDINPCLSIQGIIADLEKQLSVDQAWSNALSGARREEAMNQLEKHQLSLRSCLTHGV
ncbi:hypothetical protein [Pseudomonas sp. GL-R-19]|uniref:hypothetical protein n=1 Tax=Pseudomonas sp. GL-R-19 TaxID=2832391 RepID=UPI001CBC8C3F|nr:hypothetical protein [Pseudomonas sp. GL-R-19]